MTVALRPSCRFCAAPLRHTVVDLGLSPLCQTHIDDSELLYPMADRYRPELAAGVRYDDPAFDIVWPLPVSHVLERDSTYPDFDRKRGFEESS